MFKLTVYLKSGHEISVECGSFKFTRDPISGSFIGYEIKNTNQQADFDINQIAAYKAEVIS
ncbi:hypothetical protein HMSSN139_26580 [Paenibacillus sp. HMSSN-139]|nr:hypothetical protein HMSSN139_26580 [Paenibacillus sp. HMSSN-139]